MKKMMKRIAALLLVMVMTVSLVACGGNGDDNASTTAGGSENATGGAENPGGAEHEKFKIGVIEVQLNDESVIRANYFNDYIAPHYNCEFMFSEAISSLDAAMTFIENAAMAGCNAILNYYAIGANTEQLAMLCQEKGMIFVENGGMSNENVAAYQNYENFAGGFMADQPDTGRLFGDYLRENLNPSETHNFVLLTGGAYQGNAQQTEISANMLSALQDIYGLTYNNTIEELYTSSSPINATNDKGIEIYCYPGMANQQGWLEGLSAALQTGTYDYLLMAPNAIGNVGTAVAEVEESLNKDITIVGFGTFGDALTNAMTNTDKFGNPTVSMSTVKFTSIVAAMAFAKAYNALIGHNEVNRDAGGQAVVHTFRMTAVTSADQLAEMNEWDTDGKWVADYGVVDSFLADMTPGLTAEQMQENIDSAANLDAIRSRMGQ